MSKRKRRPDVVLDQLSYVKRRKADPHRFCNIHPELVRIWLEPDSGEVLLSSLFAAFCEELLKWKLRSIAENAQELPDPDPLPRSTASTEQAVPPVKSCVVPGSEGSNGSSVPPVERGTVFEGVSTLIDTATTSTTPVVAQETVPDVPARSAGIGTVRSDVSMLGKSEQDRIGARNVESTVAIPPLPRSTSQLPVAGIKLAVIDHDPDSRHDLKEKAALHFVSPPTSPSVLLRLPNTSERPSPLSSDTAENLIRLHVTPLQRKIFTNTGALKHRYPKGVLPSTSYSIPDYMRYPANTGATKRLLTPMISTLSDVAVQDDATTPDMATSTATATGSEVLDSAASMPPFPSLIKALNCKTISAQELASGSPYPTITSPDVAVQDDAPPDMATSTATATGSEVLDPAASMPPFPSLIKALNCKTISAQELASGSPHPTITSPVAAPTPPNNTTAPVDMYTLLNTPLATAQFRTMFSCAVSNEDEATLLRDATQMPPFPGSRSDFGLDMAMNDMRDALSGILRQVTPRQDIRRVDTVSHQSCSHQAISRQSNSHQSYAHQSISYQSLSNQSYSHQSYYAQPNGAYAVPNRFYPLGRRFRFKPTEDPPGELPLTAERVVGYARWRNEQNELHGNGLSDDGTRTEGVEEGTSGRRGPTQQQLEKEEEEEEEPLRVSVQEEKARGRHQRSRG